MSNDNYKNKQQLKRLYMDIPYELKEALKKHGAFWDPEYKLWYLPNNANSIDLVRKLNIRIHEDKNNNLYIGFIREMKIKQGLPSNKKHYHTPDLNNSQDNLYTDVIKNVVVPNNLLDDI